MCIRLSCTSPILGAQELSSHASVWGRSVPQKSVKGISDTQDVMPEEKLSLLTRRCRLDVFVERFRSCVISNRFRCPRSVHTRPYTNLGEGDKTMRKLRDNWSFVQRRKYDVFFNLLLKDARVTLTCSIKINPMHSFEKKGKTSDHIGILRLSLF